MGDVIRRGTKERPFFYIRFVDVDGTRRMRAAKGASTKAQARVALAEAERNVREGRPAVAERPIASREVEITVEQLGERFATEYTSPKLKDPEDYRKEAKSVLKCRVYPVWKDRPVSSITSLDVEKLRDSLVEDGYAKASSTLTLATISKMYSWAKKQRIIACDNPASGVERFTNDDDEPIDESQYFTKQEARALLAHAATTAPDVHPMIATALFTGMRKGELFGLRWADVSFDRMQIVVRRSYDEKPKSKKSRTIAINPALAPILAAWQKRCPRSEGWLVFPVEGVMGESYDMLGLEEILKAAGCRLLNKPWHALRHTFASHYMMAGGNLYELTKLLGHHSIKQTEKYAHLAPKHLAAGVARMSF